jgi:2,3-bisphosphoglycerate-independent phosphoglycerate mutase
VKPVVLIILDGWGIGNIPEANSQEQANIPFYRNLLNDYPNTTLECSLKALWAIQKWVILI